jgi:hypothetical protein
MEEILKVDKDYMEAFNLGYELAKELKLKSPMFKNIEPGNRRIEALQIGMEEYTNEISIGKTRRLASGKIIVKKDRNGDNHIGNELSI